jgi:hypothetical protein
MRTMREISPVPLIDPLSQTPQSRSIRPVRLDLAVQRKESRAPATTFFEKGPAGGRTDPENMNIPPMLLLNLRAGRETKSPVVATVHRHERARSAVAATDLVCGDEKRDYAFKADSERRHVS